MPTNNRLSRVCNKHLSLKKDFAIAKLSLIITQKLIYFTPKLIDRNDSGCLNP